MRQMLITVTALSMTAALCGQLMQSNRFANIVRIILGFEIVLVMLDLMEQAAGMLKWG